MKADDLHIDQDVFAYSSCWTSHRQNHDKYRRCFWKEGDLLQYSKLYFSSPLG